MVGRIISDDILNLEINEDGCIYQRSGICAGDKENWGCWSVIFVLHSDTLNWYFPNVPKIKKYLSEKHKCEADYSNQRSI